MRPVMAAGRALRADLVRILPAMPRPLIGVTLDAEKPGGYSKFPWYALRQNYLDAIDAAGGLAVALPHEPDRVADYLERIDALVVTGGAFDVDPSYYGGGATPRDGDHQGPPHRLRVRRHQGRARAEQAGARHLRRPAAPARRAGRQADPAHSRFGGRRAGARAAQPARRARPHGEGGARARSCTASSAPTSWR